MCCGVLSVFKENLTTWRDIGKKIITPRGYKITARTAKEIQ